MVYRFGFVSIFRWRILGLNFVYLSFLFFSCFIFAQDTQNSTQEEKQETLSNNDNEGIEKGELAEKPYEAKDDPAFRRLSLPPPTNLRYAQQQKWDIERTMTADAYETALVNNEEVLFVINEANIAIIKGVAIIIGEAGNNSLSNSAMSQLVEPLNNVGWVTVLVPAPTTAFTGEHNDLIDNADQAATIPTEGTAPSASAANSTDSNAMVLPQTSSPVFEDDDFSRHETQLVALMEKTVIYSGRYPGFYLVIAKGTTSAFLAKLYADQRIGQPDALVTLGTYWPERSRNTALAKYLGEIETPVLDLYNSWDTGWTKVMAKQRRIAAERALKLHYRQREIVGQAYDSEQYQYIAKEIYGWLTYMGW